MPLDRAPQLARKARVHIVALGDVGTTMLIGLLLAGQDVIGSVGMCDINAKNLARLEMEMNQICYPFAGLDGCDDPVMPPVTIVSEEDVFDCDVFIFCASKGVPPVGAGGSLILGDRFVSYRIPSTLCAGLFWQSPVSIRPRSKAMA